ncbi:MAG: Hsp20/alpha crystallin family protein [Oscillospiraceae bacterium]|nr:Hsp20/alpha crystallin family protein [Oscillospiraceae bacterium]
MFELTRRNNNHNVNTYNPFRDMEEFERSFFYPFDSFFGTSDLAEFKTDLVDEGDSYLLEADLPGFDKKDIKLDIKDDVLTVKAERHSKTEEKDSHHKVIRRERSYGCYSRQFDVSGIKTDEIKAKYDNGVLKLTLPKKEEESPKSKTLEIE